jgi:recombination protein RecA
MAKKPKTEKSPLDDAFEDAFKELDKMNPEAKFLNENALSNVKEWIDTGNYALNGVISGSLFGGIPMGRLTGLIGPESCGKTLMAMKIIANAQKKGMRVVYFDTEGALDEDTAIRLGCDPSKIKHVPVEITEQCRNQVVKFLTTIVEKGLQGKVLIVIDSVGNLITMQEKKKIDEGSDAPDMGNRAKALKSMMRAITHAAAKANCPVAFSNHIYDDPSQLHKSALKKQAGGSGPLYMSSVIVQLAKKTEKPGESDNKDAGSEVSLFSKNINGLTLRALITKNRFICPFLETEMYLNFKTGLNRYSGLLEMGTELGIITKVGHQYAFNGETLGFFKNWKDDEKVWAKILPVLDEKLKKELAFKNESVSPEYVDEEPDDASETVEE